MDRTKQIEAVRNKSYKLIGALYFHKRKSTQHSKELALKKIEEMQATMISLKNIYSVDKVKKTNDCMVCFQPTNESYMISYSEKPLCKSCMTQIAEKVNNLDD